MDSTALRRIAVACALLVLAGAPARAWSLFGGGSYVKYVSPEGDFSAMIPAGWTIERHVGNPISVNWDNPFYDGKGTFFIETVFRDPERSEYALVVQWQQYHYTHILRDGLGSYLTDVESYRTALKSGYGICDGWCKGRTIPWTGHGRYKVQMAFQQPPVDAGMMPSARTLFANGDDLIRRTSLGVHYHTVVGRENGLYDLIYPEPTNPDPSEFKRYEKLLDSFQILHDGPAAALAAKAKAGPSATTASEAPVAREKLTYSDGKGSLTMPGGIDGREHLLKRIGEICSTKNVGIKAGQEPTKGGIYRVNTEVLDKGSFRIDFECLY